MSMPSPISVAKSPRRTVPSGSSVTSTRHQIHGDAADDRAELAADHHLRGGFGLRSARRAHIAVGVPDGHDRDAARPTGGEACAITDRIAAVERADLNDAALEFDHRPHGIVPAGRRVRAVERNAGAHQVAMHRAADEDAGRIGKRGGQPAKIDPDVAKQPDLLVVQRMVGRVGAGEVAHQQRQAVILRLQPGRDGDGLFRADAEPAHAGIDMQRRAAPPALPGDEAVPLGKLGGAVDDRSQPHVGDRRRGSGHDPVEQVDIRRRSDRTQPASLGQIGDEKRPATGLEKLPRHGFEAATIGVGFHDRRALDRHGHAGELLPIRRDRCEIDGQQAARLGFGRAGQRRDRRMEAGIVRGHAAFMAIPGWSV